MSINTRVAGVFASLLLLVTLPACGLTGPKWAFHSFEFDISDKDVLVLDYYYGDSNVFGTHPDSTEFHREHINQGTSINGQLPVGDFLYVKWKVVSTDKIYEDRVDLQSQLPFIMTNKILRFDIKGEQLIIYIIEGNDEKSLHKIGAPNCLVSYYADFKCSEIYPKHWSNF